MVLVGMVVALPAAGVGLLFAGGGDLTFANKIGRVLVALDIVIRA